MDTERRVGEHLSGGVRKTARVVGVLESPRHVVPCPGSQWEPELGLGLRSRPVWGAMGLEDMPWQKELRAQVRLKNNGPVEGRVVLNMHHGVRHSRCPQPSPRDHC